VKKQPVAENKAKVAAPEGTQKQGDVGDDVGNNGNSGDNGNTRCWMSRIIEPFLTEQGINSRGPSKSGRVPALTHSSRLRRSRTCTCVQVGVSPGVIPVVESSTVGAGKKIAAVAAISFCHLASVWWCCCIPASGLQSTCQRIDVIRVVCQTPQQLASTKSALKAHWIMLFEKRRLWLLEKKMERRILQIYLPRC
jgi:hypothetical protein